MDPFAFQNKWKKKQDEKQSDLEQKYQENLAEVGGGHMKASEVSEE